MITDAHNTFSDKQAVTATAASTNVFDATDARDLGPGTPLFVGAIVNTAFAAAGAATLGIVVQASNTEGSGYVDLLESQNVGKAELVVGKVFSFALPFSAKYRYWRLNYKVGTGPMTAGAISAAWSLEGPTQWHDYKNNYTHTDVKPPAA